MTRCRHAGLEELPGSVVANVQIRGERILRRPTKKSAFPNQLTTVSAVDVEVRKSLLVLDFVISTTSVTMLLDPNKLEDLDFGAGLSCFMATFDTPKAVITPVVLLRLDWGSLRQKSKEKGG